MYRRDRRRGWWPRVLAPALGILLVFASALTAYAGAGQCPVTNWVRHNAVPLATVDPAAPLDDLEPLRRSIGDAQIVGLGESVHGAAEELTLKHRTLRLLVEQLGFRSIVWEETWTTGLLINDYILTGEGDPDALVGLMTPQWHSRDVADVLRWLRDYNAGHADKVQFVGADYYLTGLREYAAIEAYVARVAPERLDEVLGHFEFIRPPDDKLWAYVQWYMPLEDKGPYIRHAHAVYDLIASLPHRPGDREHALALHHARQIVSFYEHYNLAEADARVYRDARMAENVRWWRDYSGDKVAFWAASPHTANAPDLRIAQPSGEDWIFPSAGSYLRRWYGQRYLSIGFTFDHGTVRLDPASTAPMPPPAEDWFEHPFGAVGYDQFALDLRSHAPSPVRHWLEAPIKTRGLADGGPDGYVAGGTLDQWFDVIIHRQVVTPAQPT